MNTDTKSRPNYRIYDRTGGGVTEDIHADSLEDAIQQGRDWIEGGDWDGGDRPDKGRGVIAVCRTIELECEVGPIIYGPDEDAPAELETLAQYSLDRQPSGRLYSYMTAADYAVGEADALMREMPAALGTVEVSAIPDDDGDHLIIVTPGPDWPTVEDEEATRDADTHDCSGSYSDDEPECPVEAGWDFVSTASAGLDEFGCYSHGGTAMTHYEVCRNTGIYRDTYDPGVQRNPDEALEVVTYRERDAASEAYIVERHTDDDGFIPDWLAEHLDRSLSTRMSAEQADEWVRSHSDDDELDSDELEHAFAAVFGRRADDSDRSDGLWSHLCAHIQ